MKKWYVCMIVVAAIILGLCAGNLLCDSWSGTPAQSLVDTGKSLLYAHDILGAKAKFQDAVAQDPLHQEAQFYMGVTRILAVYEEEMNNPSDFKSVREIAELAGVTFLTYGLYDTTSSFPSQLSQTTPRTAAVLEFVKDRILAEVDGAIGNFSNITSVDFISTLQPEAAKRSGPNFVIDYADVLLLKSGLYASKALLEYMLAYDLDVSPPSLYNGTLDEMLKFKNVVEASPLLFKPKEPARLAGAKAAIINCIDSHNDAIPYVRSRSSAKNHLFVLDVPLEELTNELVDSDSSTVDQITATLGEIKSSLQSGTYEFTQTFPDKPSNRRTFDLSRLFDEVNVLDIRDKFIDENGNIFVKEETVGGAVPLGLSVFFQDYAPGTVLQGSGNVDPLDIAAAWWGYGFTPNSSAVLYQRSPNGVETNLGTLPTDSIGHFDVTYRSPAGIPEGAYSWWVVDSGTGIKSNEEQFIMCALKWSYATGSWISSSPAIASDGTVYVARSDSKLYAINPNGTLKWSYATGGYILASPAIASDGTVYVGSYDSKLYAINPNGTLKWFYETGGYTNSSPAIASDGTVYVARSDGKLYAINPNGTLKWSYDTKDFIYGLDHAPAIRADGTIYMGTNRGLYAINPNGIFKWFYETGGYNDSSPAIASDGTIYFGNEGDLLALYSSSQGLADSPWPMIHRNLQHTGNAADTAYSPLYATWSSGLCQWNGSAWTRIASVPASIVASVSSLYATWTGQGLYSWNGSAWTRIASVPASVVASGSNLYATWTGQGLYSWNGTTWTRIASVPASVIASGSSLYATWTGQGLYSWNGTTWTRIASVPASMVLGD